MYSPGLQHRAHAAHEAKTHLRALIAEAEPAARRRLQSLCSREGDIEVVASVESAVEAIEPVIGFKPDLLLLDVQLRRSTAFDLLHAIPMLPPPLVVFTTANADYAVQAFQFAAIDYLLKPFSDERFHVAVARARARIQDPSGLMWQPERWHERCNPRRLLGEKDGRLFFLDLKDIESVVAARNWVCLNVKGVTYLARLSMRRLESQLEGSSLVRVHKSFMINLDHVRYMERGTHGSFKITMHSGAPFSSSPTFRSNILLHTGLSEPAPRSPA
jgi:two-component system LytT family response regulator